MEQFAALVYVSLPPLIHQEPPRLRPLLGRDRNLDVRWRILVLYFFDQPAILVQPPLVEPVYKLGRKKSFVIAASDQELRPVRGGHPREVPARNLLGFLGTAESQHFIEPDPA